MSSSGLAQISLANNGNGSNGKLPPDNTSSSAGREQEVPLYLNKKFTLVSGKTFVIF